MQYIGTLLFISLYPPVKSYVVVTKDEFEDEGTFFVNRFPFLRTIVNKKMGI
jgi:hypothetical protein